MELERYDAPIGMVFDWKEPRYIEDIDGTMIQEHFYVQTLYIGTGDSIDNYILTAKINEQGE